MDTVEPTHTSNGLREYKCAVCGDVADSQVIPYEEMYYNNTITSFGPTTRELIGGSSWYRVTPLDISGEGTFTYPLIASNRYTVGTATVIIEGGTQTVRYDLNLNSSQITVLSESLVIYPSLDSLRTGMDAAAFEFNTPISIADNFGDDPHIILGIILKADYNALASGVQDFIPDQKQIESLIDLID